MCLRETTTLSGSSRNRYLLATTSYRSTSPERCGLGSPPSPRRCSEKALDPRHAPESATRYVHYMYLIARNTLSGLLCSRDAVRIVEAHPVGRTVESSDCSIHLYAAPVATTRPTRSVLSATRFEWVVYHGSTKIWKPPNAFPHLCCT